MSNEDVPIGDVLRSLVFKVYSAVKEPHLEPLEIRELMWRIAALKSQLRRGPSDILIRYLDRLAARLASVYPPSPTPQPPSCSAQPRRYAA